MALTLADPFSDPFFGAILGGDTGARRPQGRQIHIDLVEREKDFLLLADVPGVKKVDGDVLTLSVEQDEKGEEESILTTGAKALRRERFTKYAPRSIRLSPQADLSSIKAEYLNGVMKIKIPKKPESQPREIRIQ